MQNFMPLNQAVLVELLDDSQTIGSIIIVNDGKLPIKGKVLAVSLDFPTASQQTDLSEGERLLIDQFSPESTHTTKTVDVPLVKTGDTVMFYKGHGTPLDANKNVVLVKKEDLLGVLSE